MTFAIDKSIFVSWRTSFALVRLTPPVPAPSPPTRQNLSSSIAEAPMKEDRLALEKIEPVPRKPNVTYIVSAPFGLLSSNSMNVAEENAAETKKSVAKTSSVHYTPPILSGPFFMLPAKIRVMKAARKKIEAASKSKRAACKARRSAASLHAGSSGSGGQVGQVNTGSSQPAAAAKTARQATVSPPLVFLGSGGQVNTRSSKPASLAKNARHPTVSPTIGYPGSGGQVNTGSTQPTDAASNIVIIDAAKITKAIPEKRKRKPSRAKKPAKKPDRGIPFEEMQRLMGVYGSTKCLRKPHPPSGSDATKIDSVKRKFYRWFPDLEDRFVKDGEGHWRPKMGHDSELCYREEMRKRTGRA